LFLEGLVFYKINKCGSRVQMQVDPDIAMRIGADAWTHGKQFAVYVFKYLEETGWFFPLGEVMRPDDDDDMEF